MRDAPRNPAEIPVTDVLAIYLTNVARRKGRKSEIKQRVLTLGGWWADKTLADVNGTNCQAYIEHRSRQLWKSTKPEKTGRTPRRVTAAMARRELESLQAAINHHRRECLCTEFVSVVLAPRADAQERGLTRNEEVRLLWTAWRARQVMRDNAITTALGRPDQRGWRQYAPTAPTVQASPPSDQVEQFCTLALADVSIREKLRTADDSDQFIALVVDIARDHGLDLDARSVRVAMRRRLFRLTERGVSETPLLPNGWLPIRATWVGDQLYVQWSHFGDLRLREPFFEGTVQRCLFKPFNRLFDLVTPIAKLAEWIAARPGLPPRGFIFHMSRCGSTLVSQMLAASEQNIVVSEASPIDVVVQARHVLSDLAHDQQAQWLTWMISALGQPRCGERDYFIKLHSWHTLALPLFRRAFPSVPWIFLYRDPVEVLVSQLRAPGKQMIPEMPAADVLGLADTYRAQMPEDYVARVLVRICEPIVRHYREGCGLLVNYHELPGALWSRILPHFGVACSESERAAMAAAARYDAKTPNFLFARDVEAKQQAATPTMRAVASERLGEVYGRLETLRLAVSYSL